MRLRSRMFTVFGVCIAIAGFGLVGCSNPLAKVSGLTATAGATDLALSWQPVSGASSYIVYLSTSSSVSPSNYQITEATNATTDTVTGLTAGTTYYCVVIATSSYGFADGPYSSVVAASVGASGTSSNAAPVIAALTVWPQPVAASTQALFVVSATDSDGDTLSYSWAVDGTALSSTGSQVLWTAPSTAGSHTVTVSVSDGVNPAVTSSTTFNVQ